MDKRAALLQVVIEHPEEYLAEVTKTAQQDDQYTRMGNEMIDTGRYYGQLPLADRVRISASGAIPGAVVGGIGPAVLGMATRAPGAATASGATLGAVIGALIGKHLAIGKHVRDAKGAD